MRHATGPPGEAGRDRRRCRAKAGVRATADQPPALALNRSSSLSRYPRRVASCCAMRSRWNNDTSVSACGNTRAAEAGGSGEGGSGCRDTVLMHGTSRTACRRRRPPYACACGRSKAGRLAAGRAAATRHAARQAWRMPRPCLYRAPLPGTNRTPPPGSRPYKRVRDPTGQSRGDAEPRRRTLTRAMSLRLDISGSGRSTAPLLPGSGPSGPISARQRHISRQ